MGAFLTEGVLPPDGACPYRRLVGVGGIGTGLFFALDGNHDLGRNESRPARLLDVRDYCKLHIIAHYPAVLLGATESGEPFHVLPVGKVGDDEAGARLRREMAAAGMDVRFVEALAGAPTLQSVCFQYPDGSGGNVTTVDSAASRLAAADVDRALPFVDRGAIVLAAPEVPLAVRHHLLQIGGRSGSLRVAAIASAEAKEALALGLFADVDLLALNEDEATALTGVAFDAERAGRLLDACAALLVAVQPSIRIVVTSGPDGAFGFEQGRWRHTPALPVTVASTAGAGDALLGGVLTGLAIGLAFTTTDGPRRVLGERPLASAMDLGVLLSAYKVTSPHTIHPGASLGALRRFAQAHGVTVGEPMSRLFRGSDDDR
jgi:sugar/nucleoside kinase (ribokinase family)